MLKFISSYPISRRLVVAFALAAILPSVMIAIMGTYYVNQLSSRRGASSVIASAQDSTNNLSDSLNHMYMQTKIVESHVLSTLLVSGSANHMTIDPTLTQIVNQTTQSATQFTQDLNTYEDQYDPTQSPNMQPVMSVLNMVAPSDDTPSAETILLHNITTSVWPSYDRTQASELTLLQQVINNPTRYSLATTANKINADSNNLDSAYNGINENWSQIGGYVSGISKYIDGIDTNETQPIIVGTITAFLLTLIVVTIAGILVHRSISGPLSELVFLTRRISKGDRLARARVNSSDEISIVATAMNNMLDNIVHLVQETQSQRDLLQGQVEKLVSEVSGVGDGDLSVSAEVTADALGVLADSFNYMVEELGSLVVRVKKVAREVEESTTLTTDRMSELVDTSDRQIQEIANAAMEIERMAINSQHVAGRALALGNIARDARISAQGGHQAVQQTIEGMGRIHSNVQATSSKVQTLGERSREINNIVEAISNIAHQTNRLALDAAIQAAMAGENGKGFGAVAADIRRLAERAKELATSVGRIVRSVRDEIGAVAISMNDTERETSAGSRLAAEAGTSLESIVAVIERQADEIEGINQMAAQQQQSSSEVVQIMQSVSETTQKSTASTRDAARNVERVARLAEQLLASVEAFKLRDSMNYMEPMSDAFSENLEGALTPSGSFRTVTSTIQPINNGDVYSMSPSSSGSENYLPQLPSFVPAIPQQGNSNTNGRSTAPQPDGFGRPSPVPPITQSRPTPLPSNNFNGPVPFPTTAHGRPTPLPSGNFNGQMPFPPSGSGQQPFPAWNSGDNQQAFPPQGNWMPGAPQEPFPDGWQS